MNIADQLAPIIATPLERESETLIIDAKFKGHWEELQRGRWGELDDALREHHRPTCCRF